MVLGAGWSLSYGLVGRRNRDQKDKVLIRDDLMDVFHVEHLLFRLFFLSNFDHFDHRYTFLWGD
jgi:hypothetical protein